MEIVRRDTARLHPSGPVAGRWLVCLCPTYVLPAASRVGQPGTEVGAGPDVGAGLPAL